MNATKSKPKTKAYNSPTTAQKKAYILLQEAADIQVGDTVRVTQTSEDWVCGWSNEWVPSMLEVGDTAPVTHIRGASGVGLADDYHYPWWCLEVVERAPRLHPVVAEAKRLKEEGSLNSADDSWLGSFQIRVIRGDDYESFEAAREDGAVYELTAPENLFNYKEFHTLMGGFDEAMKMVGRDPNDHLFLLSVEKSTGRWLESVEDIPRDLLFPTLLTLHTY